MSGIGDQGSILGLIGHSMALSLVSELNQVTGHPPSVDGVAAAIPTGIRGFWSENCSSTNSSAKAQEVLFASKSVIYARSQVRPRVGLANEAGQYPIVGQHRDGTIAIAMVGGFENSDELREELLLKGSLFGTDLDGEILTHLICHSSMRTIVNRIVDALWRVKGGFAILIMTNDRLIVVRDPSGIRPIFFGTVSGAPAASTDYASLVSVGAGDVRMVRAGEMLVMDGQGIASVSPFLERPQQRCFFELMRGNGLLGSVFGLSKHSVRHRLGARLATKLPEDIDGVVAVEQDESGALVSGFVSVTSLPTARCFLSKASLPNFRDEEQRGQVWTFSAAPEVVGDKVAILLLLALNQIERVSAIVTGLREAGASTVMIFSATPPLLSDCAFGVPLLSQAPNTREYNRLETAKLLEVDSVEWLNFEEIEEEIGAGGWCHSCLDSVAEQAGVMSQLPLFTEE